jgi:polyhydroxyalkanoate synthase
MQTLPALDDIDQLHPDGGNVVKPFPAPAEIAVSVEDATSDPDPLDRSVNAALARWTGGVSPVSLMLAFSDWAAHLALAPGTQLELARGLVETIADNISFATRCTPNQATDPCEFALTQDTRFRSPEWQKLPFNIMAHSFLNMERWWGEAMSVRGMSPHHRNVTTFATRQVLDIFAPSNFPWTNPVVLTRTREQTGLNLVQGCTNYLDDLRRLISHEPPAMAEAFQVGKSVAVTPGKIVCRTPLAEIIQYAPSTERVHGTPIVIIPAWIMKYYILDLSPANSLVKYLLAEGFTVFMVSWKNPGPEDHDVGFDDYRSQGVLPAIDAATKITGAQKIHAVGYCLGGTLLAASAAAMARDGDERLQSLSFIAAQADFTEAGELKLFLDESQVSFLEDMMEEQGYLGSHQMAGAFQLLRSNDMIWSRVIRDYLLGERSGNLDILAWNADATRMPARMHTQYLRNLFMDNDLAEGHFKVGRRPVALSDLHVPMFVVGTERDHVAPWRSVYKFNLLTDADVTFLLTSGGHNGGVLSVPGESGRHYRVATKAADARYVDPDQWLAQTSEQQGSWWPNWTTWLANRSGPMVAAPALGNAEAGLPTLTDAPGTYVLMK